MTKATDLNEIDHDLLMCVFCIDWSSIKISTATKDSEHGHLLAEKAFTNVDQAY
ncbi:hypothetical protein MNBD_GAMMA10-543 [hydrothermal vent metagenome]|uniref:Uncharacterized protein n=1 Tax=hydrothermal vent metagenome TaxID=652676 RepID=A0A3B0XKR9_9ZZZZ